MSKTPPTDIIKDGKLKANIWENEGKKGTYFTTTFAKVYQDRNGELRDTNVFNHSDLLQLSELARQAYGRTNELRQERIQENAPAHDQEATYSRAHEQADDRQARAEAFLRKSRSQSFDRDMDR